MLTDEESAELAELRRRAWGASPDILDDEPALARLRELEDKGRPEEPVSNPVLARSPSLSRGGTDPSTSSATGSADDPPTSPGTGSPAFDEIPPDDEPLPERRRARRGILLLVGVVVTVVALAAGVRSILTPQPDVLPNPATARPTPQVLPALACGDGWGLSGSLSTPEGKPVWSRQFDFPISERWVMPETGRRMVGVWANLDVNPGTISDVEIVSPSTARLFYTAVKTWTAPPSPEEILANASPSIVLPQCTEPDSYPGYILSPAPACVTLEFTINGATHYTARTPVGIDEGARCITP